MNSAPDRLQFSIDNNIVLDTFYRGSSSYQTQINTAHTNVGLPVPPPIIQCNDCGAPSDTDSRGNFDLIFEKTSTTPTVYFSAYSPVQETFNSWSFLMTCPIIPEIYTISYNLSSVRGLNSTISTVNPINNNLLVVSPLTRPVYNSGAGTGLEEAGSLGAADAWSARRFSTSSATDALANNKAFFFTVSGATQSTYFRLTSCKGFVTSRSSTGPVSAALFYKINNGSYIQLANSPVTDTSTIGCTECSQPLYNITTPQIVPGNTLTLAYVPYQASSTLGVFRLHDFEILGTGGDIAFGGEIALSPLQANLPSGNISFPTDNSLKPNFPSLANITVNGAGLTALNGTYTLQTSSYEYYKNEPEECYVAWLLDSSSPHYKKWAILYNDTQPEAYISTLSADLPVNLTYEVWVDRLNNLPVPSIIG
jgi:hypothetical protein